MAFRSAQSRARPASAEAMRASFRQEERAPAPPARSRSASEMPKWSAAVERLHSGQSASRGGGSHDTLKVGDRVIVHGKHSGVLRYYGTVQFGSGFWAGVELDQPCACAAVGEMVERGYPAGRAPRCASPPRGSLWLCMQWVTAMDVCKATGKVARFSVRCRGRLAILWASMCSSLPLPFTALHLACVSVRWTPARTHPRFARARVCVQLFRLRGGVWPVCEEDGGCEGAHPGRQNVQRLSGRAGRGGTCLRSHPTLTTTSHEPLVMFLSVPLAWLLFCPCNGWHVETSTAGQSWNLGGLVGRGAHPAPTPGFHFAGRAFL
jgi:hypothetical protein